MSWLQHPFVLAIVGGAVAALINRLAVRWKRQDTIADRERLRENELRALEERIQADNDRAQMELTRQWQQTSAEMARQLEEFRNKTIPEMHAAHMRALEQNRQLQQSLTQSDIEKDRALRLAQKLTEEIERVEAQYFQLARLVEEVGFKFVSGKLVAIKPPSGERPVTP